MQLIPVVDVCHAAMKRIALAPLVLAYMQDLSSANHKFHAQPMPSVMFWVEIEDQTLVFVHVFI